jgi:two-component system phosphate regulon sensor histidine kinase PhoR
MNRNRPKPGLSRKIVAYYLCFCLVAVCWLAVGIVLTAHALVCDRGANACLSRLGKTSAAIEIHWLRHGADGLNKILNDLAANCQAASCSVVGPDGKIVAHTSPSFVGRPADEPVGKRGRWGEVTSVRYEGAAGRMIQEFRTPLTAQHRRIGQLRVAIDEPTLWATVQATAPMAPIAILAPMVLAGIGAYVMARSTRPVASIEQRLQEIARAPAGADLALEPMPARDAATFGWNRLVEHAQRGGGSSDAANLAVALEEAAQDRNNAQFEEILNRLTDGVAVTDAEGRIAFANQAVAALLGAGDADDADVALLGESLQSRLLTQASDAEDAEPLVNGPLQRTAVCELAQRADGADRILRIARLPLSGAPSRGHVWSLRDVTQQKLSEQTRDRFIDTATHELRTPLANIKAYAETLATTEYIDVELQKEFCNIINSEVTRLARFIDDLLSISSMEVGALTIERQKVETSRMFAEVLAKVEPLMQKKSIEFTTAFPSKMPDLHLDKDKIIAVLVNVLGNAAKYTPGGGRISLKVKIENGTLTAAVQDSGLGISAEDLPRLFDKFFRSDDPRVQAEIGSGLGLSLAQEVVRMHGGDIEVESVLNQGSTFAVSLPVG